MSFSYNVKSELYHIENNKEHCKLAELSAITILCMQGNKNLDNDYKNGYLKLQTENVLVAKRYFELVKQIFGTIPEIIIRKNIKFQKKKIYILLLKKDNKIQKFFQEICENKNIEVLLKNNCCKKAYIRGVFLSIGSITNPEKEYHLEFVTSKQSLSELFVQILSNFSIDAKIIKRKNYYVVYIKESEQIVNLLNIIGAHTALMELENIRILKDMRNNVNRYVNCETANLNKTISASIKQIEDIQYIDELIGIETLQPSIRSVAENRLKYTEISLKELGEIESPPVTKSCINHRLRKISTIANDLRKKNNQVI